MGFTGSDRTSRRAVAVVKAAYRTGQVRVHRPRITPSLGCHVPVARRLTDTCAHRVTSAETWCEFVIDTLADPRAPWQCNPHRVDVELSA